MRTLLSYTVHYSLVMKSRSAFTVLFFLGNPKIRRLHEALFIAWIKFAKVGSKSSLGQKICIKYGQIYALHVHIK